MFFTNLKSSNIEECITDLLIPSFDDYFFQVELQGNSTLNVEYLFTGKLSFTVLKETFFTTNLLLIVKFNIFKSFRLPVIYWIFYFNFFIIVCRKTQQVVFNFKTSSYLLFF